MRRALVLGGLLYLFAAAWGLARESRGEVQCECLEDCWCKKPGLSLFRWVFPVGHSMPGN